MIAPPWVNDYIGIPFLTNGRTREGVDCWGLYRLIVSERFGITLNDFDYSSADARDEVNSLLHSENDWKRVQHPIEGDAVLFKVAGALSHIGMIVCSGAMVHARAGQASCIERLDSPTWARRIDGFYRLPIA
jgi:cell wall-associated NlpC family hydrolase